MTIEWPKCPEEIDRLVQEMDLFSLAKKHMLLYMREWYHEYPDEFTEELWSDPDTVENTYRFRLKAVSLCRNYFFDPPQNVLEVTIEILDADEDYCKTYTCLLDFRLEYLDERWS